MGFHDTFGRIFGLAIIDIVGTFLGSLFFIFLLHQDYTFGNICFFFVIALIIGEIVHFYFNITTPVVQFFSSLK
jgi:hypothetical protein